MYKNTRRPCRAVGAGAAGAAAAGPKFGRKQACVCPKCMTQSWRAAVHPAPELSRAPSPSSLKAFRFPKRQFAIGSMGEEGSFRAEGCDAPGSGSSTVHSLLSILKLQSQLRRTPVTYVIMRVGVKHE